jgi:hypothetical protein
LIKKRPVDYRFLEGNPSFQAQPSCAPLDRTDSIIPTAVSGPPRNPDAQREQNSPVASPFLSEDSVI